MWFCCLQRINLKRSGGIHFQPTAISRRRVSKHCGRANASSGRKPKQQPAHVQLHVNQIIMPVSPFIHCLQELSEQGGQDTYSRNLLKVMLIIKYVSDDTNKVRHLLTFPVSLWCPFFRHLETLSGLCPESARSRTHATGIKSCTLCPRSTRTC